MDILLKLVDADKLGGWVRAAIGAVIAAAIARWPVLSQIMDPVTQAAIGTVVSGVVIGAWQHYAKGKAS